MIAVIQRVNNATLYSDGEFTCKIDKGLYILLGVAKGDCESDAVALAEKISKLRIFSDENDRMNLSVNDISGEVMAVSNFTLNANYAHGNRPDYFGSEEPARASALFDFFVERMKERVKYCCAGIFGSDMRTDMSTDGPVTIVMDSKILLKKG
ncbi:MAG: D-tyrosyl-tRNA(Tyr) deacylase [Clostridia bacterium]|nr:D-tyrosyl-tRNA(Tyr) deacylase [Clostridia bacterium]